MESIKQINTQAGQHIIYTDFSQRKHHVDYLKNLALELKKRLLCKEDTAYQGIQKIHETSEWPKKKTKKTLTKEDKNSHKK